MSAVTFETAINIDGNLKGDYVIVFDVDSPLTSIRIPKLVTGRINGFGVPQLWFPTPTSLIHGTTSTSVIYPDVCIWDSVATSTELIYASYLKSNGDIPIQVERWQSINNANPVKSTTIFRTVTPTHPILDPPRIAAIGSSGIQYNVAVVYNYLFNGRYNVELQNYSGTWNTEVYTDNSNTSLLTINKEPNRFPVVTYDGNGNNEVYVGWTFDNTGGTNYGNGYHQYVKIPVAVRCSTNANPITNLIYWDVPKTINADASVLSIAGRHSTRVATAWFDNTNATVRNIYYKGVNAPTTSFRYSSIPSTHIKEIKAFQIFDMQGRLIMEDKTPTFNYASYFENSNLKPGIYIVKKLSDSGQESNLYFKD